ncbi:MAG: hypothetical protein ICV84_20985, partial [Flavisolibacter sp.]|nr:hypothetical protein [Flavisolibacter sp.]
MKSIIFLFIVTSCFLLTQCSFGQPLHQKRDFTHQDTLRGSITPERAWWDVTRYDITVIPDFNKRSIEGSCTITFRRLASMKGNVMQVDLQEPMMIDSIITQQSISNGTHSSKWINKSLSFKKMGNAWLVEAGDALK